ncbi:hypothetical protein QTG54_006879 [Skeletonema marinoi]|uniref:JmjC domain-containing protein n=1 Tax=Skeletonema marinoi TaxID=267567 RepID=A0AAD8Y9J4_9STRA|nr:hypothetical protein QTG54_006879 [Skeletonema marinoi]
MSYAILTLTNARKELGTSTIERHISKALSISDSKVTAMLEDDNSATIILYPEDENDASPPIDAELMAAQINAIIRSGDASEWATPDSTCEPADDEEEVSIEEEDAYELWHNIPDEERTLHLDEIPNPDGVMILPSHCSSSVVTEINTTVMSPCEAQMKRDPSLVTFDNVDRVDVADIHTLSWDKPVIIANAVPKTTCSKKILDKDRLQDMYGDVQVRTGNRETLIDNGFTNSKPMSLSDALLSSKNGTTNTECGTIVFSPVKELPNDLITELSPLMKAFPCEDEAAPIVKKFTLTIASEGFGIGMHKHKAAMFMLLVGKKKWYMTASDDLKGVVDTHPGFYQELSSHKCIQQAGEVLFVPNDWYHEIFNLEYTLGIQALPE